MIDYFERKFPLYLCRRKLLIRGALENNKIFKVLIWAKK